MAVPKSLHEAKGLWKGRSELNQSWLPPEKRVSESPSELHLDANAAFATITYTWSYEGKPQEGTMLLAADDKGAVEIGWSDTWHHTSGVMHLRGEGLKTKGSYEGGGETWGWTIAFEIAGDELRLTMENVTPKEEAEWAVRAVYKRP